MAAKHIEIARNDGPKAGFNAWMEMMERSGLPQVQERLAEVRSQGNKKAQFEYYCNVYGNKIFAQNANVTHEDEPQTTLPGVGKDVQALFQQFLAAIGQTPTGATEAEDSLDDDDVDAIIAQHTGGTTTQRQGRSSGRSGNTRSSGRSAQRSNTGNDADQFAPRNPQDDATSGRLWRLNELGLLQIVSKPGKHISNGQAHEILKSRLG